MSEKTEKPENEKPDPNSEGETNDQLESEENEDQGDEAEGKEDENEGKKSSHSDSKKSDKEDGKEGDKEYIHKLREENKRYRLAKNDAMKRAENAEKEIKKLSEKAIKTANSISEKIEKRFINSELATQAAKEGLVDIDALKMADLSKVKLSEEGEVVGIKEVFETLRTNKPYLFQSSSSAKKGVTVPNAEQKDNKKPVYETPADLKKAENEYLNSLR